MLPLELHTTLLQLPGYFAAAIAAGAVVFTTAV